MNKNITNIIFITVIILALSVLIGTGFNKKDDVELSNYSVSDNGMKLTFKTNTLSSIGYTRGFRNIGGGVKPHYLTFYSTFGGPNSSFGAKNEFTLELDEDDSKIYFNRQNGKYELVLEKNIETEEWIKP